MNGRLRAPGAEEKREREAKSSLKIRLKPHRILYPAQRAALALLKVC